MLPRSRVVGSDQFEHAWGIYPARHVTENKRDALKQWLARVREGVPEVEMIEGAKRYRAYCDRMQLVATSYVMQPRRFFGTSRHFELPWEISKPHTPWSINAAPLEKLRSHETTALGRDEAKTLMASLRSRFEGKQA